MLLETDGWISCNDRLPEEGVRVLGWNGSYQIVKVEKGITEEQREKMKAGLMDDPVETGWCKSQGWFQIKRSESIKSADVWGNNAVPYCWRTNDGETIFGQNILYWMPLPSPPYCEALKKRSDEIMAAVTEEQIKKMADRLLFGLIAVDIDKVIYKNEEGEKS